MGLTIQYQLSVPNKWSIATVRDKLEALRQTCLDLPVAKVSELMEFKGDECHAGERTADPFRWAKIQAARYVSYTWQPGYFCHQPPHHMLVFTVRPARGCEAMNIGICSYPPLVEPKRQPGPRGWLDVLNWSLAITDAASNPESARVLKGFAKRWKLHRLPWSDEYHRREKDLLSAEFYRACVVQGRYRSHRKGYAPSWVLVELDDCNQGHIRWRFKGGLEEAETLFASAEFKADMERFVRGEEHTVPGDTGRWDSFCKTQFANEFGMSNFLRAHMSVCAILEKAQDLGFKVTVSDESDLWQKRDVKALAEVVGQWDQMLAALFGAMKDAAPGVQIESPMQNRADFEHLEMKAIQSGYGTVAGKIADYLAQLKLPKPQDE